jgi:hypothetical protein
MKDLQKAMSVAIPTYDFQSITKSIQPILPQIPNISDMIKPIMELSQSFVSSQLKSMLVFKPLENLLSAYQQTVNPIYFIGSKSEATTDYLSVSFHEYGEIRINGKLFRANLFASRHGKLLSYLVNNPRRLVTSKEVCDNIRVLDADRVFIDLKKELRLAGYRLKYKRYRAQGIIYFGVLART